MLGPATQMGPVHLTVADLHRATSFYESAIGLVPMPQPDGSVLLGGAARLPPLLSLRGDGAASPRDRGQTGLYHFAILVPSRRDLAVALVRLARAGWSLDGASDHLVSEALYLSDPDGNGIEIYSDRDRSQWPRDTAGGLRMATLPLDIDDLLEELRDAPPDPERDAVMPDGTRIGHVHLQVAELEQIERFYVDLLGFDVMFRLGGSALFISAGGYHHHLGLNTWHSHRGSSPAAGGVGLRSYVIELDNEPELDEVLGRLQADGVPFDHIADYGGAVLVRDPSGNAIELTASASTSSSA